MARRLAGSISERPRSIMSSVLGSPAKAAPYPMVGGPGQYLVHAAFLKLSGSGKSGYQRASIIGWPGAEVWRLESVAASPPPGVCFIPKGGAGRRHITAPS